MIRVSILVENTARGMGVLGEHGLAWWIDTGSHQVLFDTGQGLVLAHNALRLGASLSKTSSIVLSHGHLDHVGGLEAVLTAAPYASLHLHPDATLLRFTGSDGKGIARRLSSHFMESSGFNAAPAGRRIVISKEATEIVPGL